MKLRADAKSLITTMVDPVEDEDVDEEAEVDSDKEQEDPPAQQVLEKTLSEGIQSIIDATILGDSTEDFTQKYLPANQEASRREWKKTDVTSHEQEDMELIDQDELDEYREMDLNDSRHVSNSKI